MIWWHMYIVYDVRLDVHVPSAIKTTAYYHVLYCRTSVSNPRVVYNVQLDILADLTLELREEHEAKGELLSYMHTGTQPPTCIYSQL